MKADILFLSKGDAARGPMACALLQKALGPAATVASCGLLAGPLHPLAVQAMAECGLDIGGHRPRALRDLVGAEAKLCINLCFGEPGPTLAGRMRRLDWPTPDPRPGPPTEEATLARMRGTRELLTKRVRILAQELLTADSGPGWSARLNVRLAVKIPSNAP